MAQAVVRKGTARKFSKGLLRKSLTCCSSCWSDAVLDHRAPYPPAGMVLSSRRVMTGNSHGKHNSGGLRGSRRFTPPAVVGVEDMLDGLTINQAEHYYHPSALTLADLPDDFVMPPSALPADAVALLRVERGVRLRDWPVKRYFVKVRSREAKSAAADWVVAGEWTPVPPEPVLDFFCETE